MQNHSKQNKNKQKSEDNNSSKKEQSVQLTHISQQIATGIVH